MLSTLLRPKRSRRRVEGDSIFSTPQGKRVHAKADWTEDDSADEGSEDDENDENNEDGDAGEDDDEQDEDADEEDGETSPLLPIFSAAHLDALPVYNLTHAIRLIVLPRTETTLTWDQLRSPQVSQFLVKPMQQQIRTSHFSRATVYALMANCLQFQKESQANPGNAGTSRTRALVCELLAIKLLKEYNTRELIDALSYDFFPLQGVAPPERIIIAPNGERKVQPRPVAARISTLEVAIRASAKRFLAHPLVVQQLEAIWAGTIVFHSAADNLHRQRPNPPKARTPPNPSSQSLLASAGHVTYGSTNPMRARSSQDKQGGVEHSTAPVRRTVTLYDPRDASLFKLSRLRVPRYRQFFSTCSLAILLGLFVAVLVGRSTEITWLEVVFWFWSAGFMLDEVVGFNEQGFSLYIMSFWNAFDLGILLLLTIYYCMRLYGIFLVDHGRLKWNSMAYDVLATNAILLFPRLFSVLDHYRYFSQLLIAFRLMAIDLVAVFVLILVACSGFFVAFTFSFGKGQYDAGEVAYKIFQILMGFTPAAWEAWPTYNPLGKALLVLFLFICHFLIVTILITVLTNSFMAIVSNAEQEHQFVFAVNTISMVKNDALFSYVAPSNIFAWFLTPLRYVLPFRIFIKLNRTVIKITHFPLLFGIFAYEKLFLARSVFEPTDLIENKHRGRNRIISFQDGKASLFSPTVRMRQDSVAGFQKDIALEEVFRLRPDNLRNLRRVDRRQTLNVVSNWMDRQSGIASPPMEQDHAVVDRLERRRQFRQAALHRHRGISGTRSIASDPAEFMSTGGFHEQMDNERAASDEEADNGDGDDELNTHDEDEGLTLDQAPTRSRTNSHDTTFEKESESEDYFTTPTAARLNIPYLPSSVSSREAHHPIHLAPRRSSPPRQRRSHDRTMSSNTILFNPLGERHSFTSPPKSRPLTARLLSNTNSGAQTPTGSGPNAGNRTPRNSMYSRANPRPIILTRGDVSSVPSLNIDARLATSRTKQIRHRRSSLDMGMSDLGLDTHAPGTLGAVPSSFATQMAMATGGLKAFGGRQDNKGDDNDGMMGRLMLARMKTLEEGFAEVVKEFRGMRTAGNSSVENDGLGPSKGKGKEKLLERGRKKKTDGSRLPHTTSEVDFSKMADKGKGKENKGLGLDIGAEMDTPAGEIIGRYMSKGSSL